MFTQGDKEQEVIISFTFKPLYRKNVTRSLLSVISSSESAQELCKKVTLLDSIDWIVEAWNDVKKTTIQRCFHATGFGDSVDIVIDDDCEFDDDVVPLAVLVRELAFLTKEFETLDADLHTEFTIQTTEGGKLAF